MILSVSVALLLLKFGSVVPVGAATLAVLTNVDPLTFKATKARAVIVTTPAALRVVTVPVKSVLLATTFAPVAFSA